MRGIPARCAALDVTTVLICDPPTYFIPIFSNRSFCDRQVSSKQLPKFFLRFLGGASLNFNLASMYLFSSSCNFSSRPPRPSPSSTRLRLVELGLGLGGLEWSQRWSTSCNFSQVHLGQVEVQLGFASLDFNLASMDLIGVCGGSPRATPLKFNFGQVEVQLGFASLNFNLASMDLIGVCGGSPRATPLKFNSVKFKFNSASPR